MCSQGSPNRFNTNTQPHKFLTFLQLQPKIPFILLSLQTRIFGTKGELEGDGEDLLTHFDFLTRSSKTIHPSDEYGDGVSKSGHYGGDFGLMKAFVYACVTGNKEYIVSGPQETMGKILWAKYVL